MNYANLIQNITENIKTNGSQAITAQVLQNVLVDMVGKLGQSGSLLGGVIDTSFVPNPTNDAQVVYLAEGPGTYTNFNGLVVGAGEVAFFYFNGNAWVKSSVDVVEVVNNLNSTATDKALSAAMGKQIGDNISQLGQQVIYDVSANNDGATFASLSALLSSENLSTLIPIAVRCGGMSIRFKLTSDNKYVQYFLAKKEWSASEADWQKMNLEEEVSLAVDSETTTEDVPVTVGIHTVDGENGYWNAQYGVFVKDSSRRATEKIDVSEGEVYKITMYVGSSGAIAFLAQWNGNSWVGRDGEFTAPTHTLVTDKEYIVPAGVTKIAFTSNNMVIPSIKKVTKVTEKVFKAYTKEETDDLLEPKADETDLLALETKLDGINTIKKYGLKWSITDMNDLGARCFDAVGLSAEIGVGTTDGTSDFDNIYPWSGMKRCNINVNANGAKIVTFEGEPGFALDGSNGDVFVRVPKFYIEKYIKDGYEYRVISENGNVVHPAFVENGMVLDEIFIGAFEGVIQDTKLRSIGGVIPSNNEKASTFLTAAKQNGVQYTLYDMRSVDAIWMLMAVEFGCRNTNQIIGYGFADYQQPIDYVSYKVSVAATNTNTVVLGKPIDEAERRKSVGRFRPGCNICICDGSQYSIVAQRHITSVSCPTVNDYLTITFDGEPIDVATTMFAGNAPATTNYCETIGDDYKLNWHTGRSNQDLSYLESKTINPCRYRWIENVVGNLWHILPDVTFKDLQMYVCDNMSDYSAHKYTSPYRPVGPLLPLQSSNGVKQDVNTQANPNYWLTSLLDDIFAKGNCFGKSYDTAHDGTITSVKGFGGYYYLYNGVRCIVNGGGFDHLWRCNMLTNRAWLNESDKWYLYGGRLLFKNI